MIPFDLKTLAKFSQGRFFGEKNTTITSITTDSRKVVKGSLFACIKGEKADGHDYIESALEKGAAGIISEKELPGLAVPYILTDSTLTALQNIAREILLKAGIPVIAVGGSVGKTSTKEMIASVLSQKFNVLKTQANFNNELGLPLTIFELEKEHTAAVLELGIDDFGQMHVLAGIAKPDICVLTNIGDCHLEKLGDRNGVLKAKTEMFDHMKPGGRAVLNGDDEKLRTVTAVQGKAPLFYGFGEKNELTAVIKDKDEFGSFIEIDSPIGRIETTVNMPGAHMVMNAMAAAGVGVELGLDAEMIAAGIEKYRSIDGRFMLNRTDDYIVVDDCYNANPMSMKASLSALSEMNGRHVAILGDMGDLADASAKLHYEVGAHLGGLNIEVLCCVGTLCRELGRGAEEAYAEKQLTGRTVRYYDSKEELIADLPAVLKKDDIILVKASHFMEFDEIVKYLK